MGHKALFIHPQLVSVDGPLKNILTDLLIAWAMCIQLLCFGFFNKLYFLNFISFQIGHDKKPPENCEAFVDVNNMITCEIPAFKAFLKAAQNQ